MLCDDLERWDGGRGGSNREGIYVCVCVCVCECKHKYIYIWFTTLCSRNQYDIIKQLSVQFSRSSRVQLFATPWTAARQASLSITNSQNLLKLMSIDLVMPSNHLILSPPFLLLSICPSIRVFSIESREFTVLYNSKPDKLICYKGYFCKLGKCTFIIEFVEELRGLSEISP